MRSVSMRSAVAVAESAKMTSRIQQLQLGFLQAAIEAAFSGESFKPKLPDDEFDLSFGEFEPDVADKLLQSLNLEHAALVGVLPSALDAVAEEFTKRTKEISAAPLPTIEIPSVEELRDKYSKPIVE